MKALWQQIKDEVRAQLVETRMFTALSGTETNNLVTLKRYPDLVEGSEKYARLEGLALDEDTEVLCAQIGGKPVVLGPLRRSGRNDYGISYRNAPQDVSGRYYDTRNVLGGRITSVGVNNNQLYGYPFYVGPTGFPADRISIDVTGSAAGNARLGVYAMHATNFEPGALLLDAGTVSVSTTGVKTITIAQTFTAEPPHYLIWLALLTDVIPTIEAMEQGSILPFMGLSEASPIYSGFSKIPQTYGALPSTFSPTIAEQAGPLRIQLRRA